MDSIFRDYMHWPEESVIKITTTDGNAVVLHTPILNHRWPLFRDNQEEALAICRSLTKEQLQSVLLYAYSDLPAKRPMLPIFNQCGLVHPQSLQDSTFIEDMRSLLHDQESTDFELLSDDGRPVRAHCAILVARSKFFKSLFLSKSIETQTRQWKCSRPISYPTLQFLVEYLYTGQISAPAILDVIPLCWTVKYLICLGEKEVENIVASALSREINDSNVFQIQETAEKWEVKPVADIVTKYLATRKQ